MSEGIDRKHLAPPAVQELERIDLIAEVIADGVHQGLRRSRRIGWSSEFSGFKPYCPGDDMRLIDWRVYARSDKLLVRRYEAETDLEVLLLLDATKSMAWRWEQTISKLEYSANLLAALASLHMRQQNQVGLLIHDAHAVHHLPPKCKTSHLERIFSLLEEVRPGSQEAFSLLVDEVASAKRHRGAIIVCSDLEEDPAAIERALEDLATRDDAIHLLHVLDEAEIELPFEQVTHLQDSETGEMLPVDIPRLRRRHREQIERMQAGWRNKCLGWGIAYQPVHTGMSYVDVICSMFQARGA